MSVFKLPLPRRLLRCDTSRFDALHHDDALVGRDLLDTGVFDEIATFEPSPSDAPDLLLVIDELVDELANSNELTISLTLIAEVDDQVVEARVAEVA